MINTTPEAVALDGYLSNITPVERELLRLFPFKRRLVLLDIGGCEGEESIRYARRFPQARVFTFEPLPANLKIIRENFRRYHIQNAELVPLALSDKTGEAEFHVSSGRPPVDFAGSDWNYGNKSSSLLPPVGTEPMFGWVKFDEKIKVQTDTLDHFASGRGMTRIDFIHMDVQGAEHLVLKGAPRSLRKTTAIWLEVSDKELYRGQRLRADIEATMQAAGFDKIFEIIRDVEGDQFYVNRRHPSVWPYLLARKLLSGWRSWRAKARS